MIEVQCRSYEKHPRALTPCARERASIAGRLVALWLVLAMPVGLSAQAPLALPPNGAAAAAYRSAIAEARQLLVDLMTERAIPGLSVAVGVDGGVVWSEGMGLASLEHGVPVTPLTRFRTGSTAKPMTAAVLAVLYERGLVDLDAEVGEYVTRWPEQHRPITIRQLVGHLSGIRHYDPEGLEFFNSVRYTNLLDALEIFDRDALLFEPGTRYSYSTYGYNLLGAALQQAAGRPFVQLVREVVFEPLGMSSSVTDHTDSIIAHRTSFYERSGGGSSYHTRQSGWQSATRTVLNGPYTDNSNKAPGGGFLTTPTDLVRFGSAHLMPGFLKESTLQLLFAPQRTNSGEETSYGLGWQLGEDSQGHPTIGHGGGAVGGTSQLLMHPDLGLVVALQVNLTDAGIGRAAREVAAIFRRELAARN